MMLIYIILSNTKAKTVSSFGFLSHNDKRKKGNKQEAILVLEDLSLLPS